MRAQTKEKDMGSLALLSGLLQQRHAIGRNRLCSLKEEEGLEQQV